LCVYINVYLLTIFTVELLIWFWIFIWTVYYYCCCCCYNDYGGGGCGGDDCAIDTAVLFPSTETTVTKNINYCSAFKTTVYWVFNIFTTYCLRKYYQQ